MTEDLVIDIAKNSLLITIYCSMPMLLASLVIGLIVSIIQTTTSLQEQTLTFVPKIIGIFLAIIFLGPWILHTLLDYINRLWMLISTLKP